MHILLNFHYFSTTYSEPEVQILDYQAQQYKLLPMVAFSHACKATFIALMDTYKTATQDLEKGDLATLPEVKEKSIIYYPML